MASRRKISIKWKLFSVVAVLITVAIFVIVSRTSSIFRQDKESFVKELSAKLASSTSKNFLTRITTLQDKLVIFISSKESLAHTGAKAEDQLQVLFSRYQNFLTIGFLKPDDSGRLAVEWIARNPQGAAEKWPANYEKGILTSLNFKGAAANGRGFWRAQAPNGDWLAVLGFGVQVLDVSRARTPRGTLSPATSKLAWIIGIMPGDEFDDLLSDFSTGLNTGFVVDDQGIAVAHSDPSVRWTNVKSLPIVSEAISGDRPDETGDFVDGAGRAIIGSYESIPKMNLYAIVTTPRDKAFQAADEMSRDIMIIGSLILMIALATAVLLSNYLTGPLQRLASVAAKIGAGDFKVPVDVESNDEIGELAGSFKKMEADLIERDEKLNSAQLALVQSEKMSAFGQLSAGIAHEVKNPLAGILGHAQLAMGKVQSDDVKKHLEVIEKETRRCKTIVENLMKFARAEKAELKPTNLAQVAQDTINLVDHQLTLAGCKIFKDFRSCPMVDANGNMLQQVLLNLMVNASHAMETCPTKNVTVRVLQVGNKAQIQVEDTGTGMPPEVQKKIFEPFFTTKPAGKGTGLGLSVSIGIVKDHKGEIYIKSEQGKGTTFFIDIPIPENAAMPDKPLENSHGGQWAPGAPDPATLTAATSAAAPSVAAETKPAAAKPAAAKPEAAPNDAQTKTAAAAPTSISPSATSPLPKGLPTLKVASNSAATPTPAETNAVTAVTTAAAATASAAAPSGPGPAVRTVASEEDFIFSETTSTKATQVTETKTSLGGKTALDDKTVTKVQLPDLPPDAGEEPANTGTAAEFKVKIKRPKLKV